MKIVFFGTPYYSANILKLLYKRYNRNGGIIGVVTQPPKPVGRKQFLEYSPVDNFAHKRKIPIFRNLTDIPKADLGILAAYGNIVPKKVLGKFKYGILNIHPSLLPKYRGASPVQAAIAAGERFSGVSVIKMDEKLDHGPIVSSFKEEIKPDDTQGSLTERLFERSGEFILRLIPSYISGKINLKVQDESSASFTTPIKREHGFILPEFIKNALEGKESSRDWEIAFLKNYTQKANPITIERFIRATNPWPTAYSEISLPGKIKKRLKIFSARLENKKLILERVQLEGKNTVSYKQFIEGYPEARFEK